MSAGLLILGVEGPPAPSPLRPLEGEGATTQEKGRADSPDSGGGGYFTLSDSDLGTESPQGSSMVSLKYVKFLRYICILFCRYENKKLKTLAPTGG